MEKKSVYYTEEVRTENVRKLFTQLANLDMDFNSMVFAFADTIQSTFLNAAMGELSEEEQAGLNIEITELINKVITVLEGGSKSSAVDMIVMCNLMMDAAEGATMTALGDDEA